MALTTVDTNAALVLIDLQKGIVGLPVAHDATEIVRKGAELAKAFRSKGLPVVLVNVTAPAPGRTDMGIRNFNWPENWTDLVPELEVQESDYLISKQRVGAFHGTSLDAILKERGVTQVFLAGVATGSGVESTGRSAFDLGYHVVFVTDAMTDMRAETHQHCVERAFPRLGETTTTVEVVERLGATK